MHVFLFFTRGCQRLIVVAQNSPGLKQNCKNIVILLSPPQGHLGSHEAVWRHLAAPGEAAHPRAGDEVKVLLAVRVKEGHRLVLGVVGGHLEGDDLEVGEAGRHAQHLAAMTSLVDVPLRRVWVRHAGRVAAHNVEVGAGGHASLGVPLHLRGACRAKNSCECL